VTTPFFVQLWSPAVCCQRVSQERGGVRDLARIGGWLPDVGLTSMYVPSRRGLGLPTARSDQRNSDHDVTYIVIRADRFQSLVKLVRAHRESVIQTNCQDCQEELMLQPRAHLSTTSGEGECEDRPESAHRIWKTRRKRINCCSQSGHKETHHQSCIPDGKASSGDAARAAWYCRCPPRRVLACRTGGARTCHMASAKKCLPIRRGGSGVSATTEGRVTAGPGGGASWGSDQKDGQANEHPVHEMNRINVLYCHDLAHQDQWKRSN
jgi:hypothetical protein